MKATTTGSGARPNVSPRESIRQLDGEIAAVREELGGLVAELDRRRHELLDVKLQVRRHAVGITLTGVTLLSSAAGLVWLGHWYTRRRPAPLSRAGRVREAVSRMIDKPERVAVEAGIPAKILTAAANAAIAIVLKRLLERGLQAALSRSPRRVPRPSSPAEATLAEFEGRRAEVTAR